MEDGPGVGVDDGPGVGDEDGPGVAVDEGPGVGVEDGPGVGVDDGPGVPMTLKGKRNILSNDRQVKISTEEGNNQSSHQSVCTFMGWYQNGEL